MNKDLLAVFEYLEREKGIKRDVIIAAVEESLLAAARKSIKGLLSINVRVNPKTADIEVTAQKEVVDKVTIPDEEISLEEAKVINPYAEIGQWIDIPCTPQDFGRIAAQTAKQVMAQQLRSAERDVIYAEYRDRVGEIISGTVKRAIRGATLVVDLGKVEGILPDRFYPKTEKYNTGDRVCALLYAVRDAENGGAEIILSRSHPEFVRQLFYQEVPELQDGTVTIEKIVRDPGYRTKLAVKSSESKVDPVGACVGVRGTRVKNIIRELNNEKIDIIPYIDDLVQLLVRALAPIEIRKIDVNEENKVVTIIVDDESYPAVLGKRGMNARLNGELIGAELQVQKMSDYQQIANLQRQQLALADDPSLDIPLDLEGMSPLLKFAISSVISAGYDTPRKVLSATPQDLAKIPEISIELATKIIDEICKKKGLKIG
jgi:transcription termination/antitermination protein NusA